MKPSRQWIPSQRRAAAPADARSRFASPHIADGLRSLDELAVEAREALAMRRAAEMKRIREIHALFDKIKGAGDDRPVLGRGDCCG
jgi:hypothetical protein